MWKLYLLNLCGEKSKIWGSTPLLWIRPSFLMGHCMGLNKVAQNNFLIDIVMRSKVMFWPNFIAVQYPFASPEITQKLLTLLLGTMGFEVLRFGMLSPIIRIWAVPSWSNDMFLPFCDRDCQYSAFSFPLIAYQILLLANSIAIANDEFIWSHKYICVCVLYDGYTLQSTDQKLIL